MHKTILSLLVAAGLAVLCGGCREDSEPAPGPSPGFDASRVRRLLQPPEGEVRAVPPHAIHGRGVGPYVLGTSLRSILGLLPRGPRVMLMQIDGLVDYSLVRAEADTLLIGVEPPTGVTFLSVLDDATARTGAGVGVGTAAADLGKALGAELAAPNRAVDPRLLVFARLPNARFLLDGAGGHVVAVVVRQDERAPEESERDRARGGAAPARGVAAAAAAAATPCLVEGEPPAREAILQAAALVSEPAAASASADGPDEVATVGYACFAAPAADAPMAGAVVSGAGQVAVVGGEPGKLRRLAVQPVPGLVYAAPLDVDGDGRSEIAIVAQRATAEEHAVSLELLRLEGGRLHRLVAQDVYRVSATNAAWVGARLEEIDLMVELRAEAEAVQVTGLYVHRGEARPQTVAPLVRVDVPVRPVKRPAPAAPASAPASSEPADAAAAGAGDASGPRPRAAAPADARVASEPGGAGAAAE